MPGGFDPSQLPQMPGGFDPSQGGGAGNPIAGMGGLLGGAGVDPELRDLLLADADDYTWVAATTGANNAASYQLATERSVMPIGGFNGSDPSPTLAEFQQLVRDSEIHYYLGNGLSGMTSMGGSESAQQIATWVDERFTATTVGGVTVYDLTRPR
jgi:hypothetical protein